MESEHLRHLTAYERAALEDFVSHLRQHYAEVISKVILFGSKARGDSNAESDIDLLIVTHRNDWEFQQQIDDLTIQTDLAHNVVISDMMVSAERYTQMRQQREPLYRRIEQEGIHLWPEIASKTI